MPRLNTRGQALMNPSPDGSGVLSVDRREYFPVANGGCWLNVQTILANVPQEGRGDAGWRVLARRLDDPELTVLEGAANRLVAGGDRWLGWSSHRGLFGSLGNWPQAGLLAAGHDGTLAWRRDHQGGRGLVLTPPDGSPETVVPDAVVIDCQVLGPQTAVWFDGARLQAVGRDVPRLAVPAQRTRLLTIGGEPWAIYWSEDTGLVAQLEGASDGYVLERRPIAYHHDAITVGSLGGVGVYAWSTTEGERPQDLVWDILDRSAPRVPLVEVARIGRPLWLGWFVFGGQTVDGLPANCFLMVRDPMFVVSLPNGGGRVQVLAQYVAGRPEGDLVALADALETAREVRPEIPRLAYWTRGPQAGLVPPSELVGIEAYAGTDETPAALETRLRRSVLKVVEAGAIPWLVAQGYTQPPPSTLVTDLPPLVSLYARLCRDLPMIGGVLVFSAGTRPGGWAEHPEIHDAWRRLADGLAGTPALPAYPDPPRPEPVPRPSDPPDPHPPIPAPAPWPRALEVTYMDAEIVGLIGPSGKFLRIDPGQPTRINFDRDTVGAHERFEVTQPDAKFTLRAVEANVILNGAPKWGCDGTDRNRQFETRPADARGAHEQWTIVEMPDGRLDAFVEHETDDGRQFTSAHLTVVRGV